ncbi:MAG: cytochrome c oxidase subunit II [Bacteroidales bacterium]
MYSTTGIDASNFVAAFNLAFIYITSISLILLVGITVMMFSFVLLYNKKRNQIATQITGNNLLETTWTVIPTLLALTMFHFGWAGWRPTYKPPKDAMNVTSTARMWSFSFSYPNGIQSSDLVIPIDTPVRIKLVSLDVVHSLYIPAFRIKSDFVPGRIKYMWFTAEKLGKYDIFCAEYCGLNHSFMRSDVRVLTKDDYKAWSSDTSRVPKAAASGVPGAEGLALLQAQGCLACHSTNGTKIVGPSYLGLYGSQVTVLRNGKEITVTADDDYITRSIYDPNYDIVKGYPANLMQSYKATLNQSEVQKIIEYLKTIGEKK